MVDAYEGSANYVRVLMTHIFAGRRIGSAIVVCAMLTAPATAFIPSIDRADADRALKIARSRLAAREAFSNRYSIEVLAPTVDLYTLERIEIVTEFRRMERIAEDRLPVDATFGAGGTDELIAAIRPWRHRLSVVAHLQLGHGLLGANPPVTTIAIDGQTPISVTVRTFGGGKGPPTAADAEAIFDSTPITSSRHTIRVLCNGAEVARQEVDFSRFE